MYSSGKPAFVGVVLAVVAAAVLVAAPPPPTSIIVNKNGQDYGGGVATGWGVGGGAAAPWSRPRRGRLAAARASHCWRCRHRHQKRSAILLTTPQHLEVYTAVGTSTDVTGTLTDAIQSTFWYKDGNTTLVS